VLGDLPELKRRAAPDADAARNHQAGQSRVVDQDCTLAEQPRRSHGRQDFAV
jgi:hypothetical protein